jgi:hypothetical protein
LVPTSFYAEAMLAVLNAAGETAFSFASEESFEIHGGELSGALGPNNAGFETDTKIFGADVYWKWKSATAFQGFPFVSFQSEALMRSYDTAERFLVEDPSLPLPAETLDDQGAYGELLWGFKPRWVVGARGDVLQSDESAFFTDLRTDRYRISPSLTWYPSEYSKIRWQYNLDHRDEIGFDHSFWMQIEIILGAHAAHVF